MRLLLVLPFLLQLSSAQQAIRVTNAASGGFGFAPTASFAPGSLIRIQLDLTGITGGIVPIDPATVSLQIQPAGSADAVGSTDPTSVTARLSTDIPLGPATLTMTFNGQTSAPAQINIVPSSFGLFTGSSGTGPVSGQNLLTQPARPRDLVSLHGTGLGSATADQVSVLLGGHPFPISAIGPAPDQPGADQIDFQLPDDPSIPYGCYVAVAVRVQDTTSNVGTLSTARDQGACQSPFGFTPDQMAQLDAGQSVYLGQVNLYNMVGHPPASQWFYSDGFTRMESADALFLSVNASSAAGFTEPLRADDVYYACSRINSGTVGILGLGGPLSAGSKLVLSSDGKSLDVPLENPLFPSLYRAQLPVPALVDTPDAVPPPFFAAGTWQIAGGGSASVQPFTGQLSVPPPVRILNSAGLASIDTTQDLIVQWNGSDYTDDYTATLQLSASSAIACRAPASAGQVIVPAALMAGLSQATYGTGVELLLTPKPGRLTIFQMSLANGGTVPTLFRYYPSQVVPAQIP